MLVRLIGTASRDGGGEAASELGRALTERSPGQAAAGETDRLPADAPRLGTRLRALADGLERDAAGAAGPGRAEPGVGAEATAVRAVLGDATGEPATLRLARERGADDHGGGGGAGDEAGSRLVLDVAFVRVGRFRLEVDRPGGSGAELRIALRGERPLPAGARADLLDLVGAAFELGGARARLVVSTGGLPPPAPTRAVVA